MAEYNEVIKQFKRMCKSISPAKCTRGECLMGCENIGQCRKVAFERPEKFEEQVMAWAKEHTEPVYPTWLEWLMNKGFVTASSNQYGISYNFDWNKHIPADIAEKLGLQPKEG